MADMEARMATVEFKVDEHGKRIDGLEQDCKTIHQSCADERVSLAEMKLLIQTSIAQTDKTTALLKWVVLVVVALVGAIAGVKIAIPDI